MSVRPHPELASHGADGEVIGSFSLGSELGSGLLTRIHAAVRLPDGAPCSVKRLQPAWSQDMQSRALLVAAGRSVLGVSAPGLVAVHEVHEQPEPYLVLERVEGLDLATLLAGLSLRDAARFALPVVIDALHGLHALHTLRTASGDSGGLVHGAPHARHMLVGTDGRGRIVDLTHSVGPGTPWSAKRDPRREPRLLAPEQVLAPAHVDARADIYIAGSVLWQVLTGKALSRSVGKDGAPRALLQHAPPPPSELGGSCGNGLDRVCTRALDRARARRFASALELASALREAAERSLSLASPEEIGALVRSLEGRARGADAAQLAARVTLLGVGGREPGAEASPTRRPRTLDVRARRVAPPAAPLHGATEQFAPGTAHQPAFSRAAPQEAPSTQLEFTAAQTGEHAPLSRASTSPRPIPAALRWHEPSPSLPPRGATAGNAKLKYTLTALALALPALGLSLGLSVHTDDVRAALERHLGVTVGAAEAPEQASATASERPSSTLPTAPRLEEPGSSLDADALPAAPPPIGGSRQPPRGTSLSPRAAPEGRVEPPSASKSVAFSKTTREGAAVAARRAFPALRRAEEDTDSRATRLADEVDPAVPANPY